MRVAKNLKIAGDVSANISVDLFNVFNSDTLLRANRNITSDAFRGVLEVINPRILRVGVRLQF